MPDLRQVVGHLGVILRELLQQFLRLCLQHFQGVARELEVEPQYLLPLFLPNRTRFSSERRMMQLRSLKVSVSFLSFSMSSSYVVGYFARLSSHIFFRA